MPPRKGAKGKKGKKDLDEDAYWQSKASSNASPAGAESDAQVDVDRSRRSTAAAFASLNTSHDDDLNAGGGDSDEDGGGLMAAIAKSSKSKKEKKTKAAPVEEEEDREHIDLAAPRGAVEVNAEDWMDAEFGDDKKSKKGKKGGNKKAQQKKQDEDSEDEAAADAQVEAVIQAVEQVKLDDGEKKESPQVEAEEDRDDQEDDQPNRVLSKKEKEKLKKEKEKAKKKAQAAAKKAHSGDAAPAAGAPAEATPAPPPPAATAAANDDAEDDGDEAGGDAASKNKKKKKKKAADKPVVEKAAPAPKLNPKMAALRAAMEAQKAAQEEAKRLEEEEQARIEEEERKAAEEERLRAEEKAKKKEKEKAKKDQLRKEGKLLTPKQKAEKAAAEARLKALVGTEGVLIAGLQKGNDGETARKVSYGSKKKSFHKNGPQAAAEPVVEEKLEAAPVESVNEEENKEAGSDNDVKDDWDASDVEDVKDDWDASSSEDEEKEGAPAKVAPAAAPAAKASNGKAKAAPKSATTTTPSKGAAVAKASPAAKGAVAKPAAKGGKAAVVESSSEEDDDEDDSDDDDEDDSDDDSDDDDSDHDSDDDSSEDENGMTSTERMAAERKAAAKERRLAKAADALKARSKDDMRSPICVILGHVDTGKTKLLDKIRQTNVQEGEAGGITQQIGATYFPMEAIRSKTGVLGDNDLKEYKLPGLLVIDTPGHESFTNLRTRGSSLCNIAILVVDIMHGLEPQTLESLRLLREGKTPFIVALNKIDRLYGWKAIPNGGFQESLASQSPAVKREFEDRLQKTILAFAEQGLNSLPYYKNKDFARVVSLVPTSAHTGEGVPDMLMLIIKLTQERMAERLMYISTLECTVLEVKVIEGLGTTIDVVLSNGVLREGDKIVVCGLNGAIVTQVRALLTPQPMKELRIKGQYVHHKEVKASLGIKIVAPDLEKAIAGSRLLVVTEDDDEDELREEVMSDLTDLMNSVDKTGKGVCVQASTLGSLEALLEFLRVSKIPVSGINIGPVHKKDVVRASTMLEKHKEFAVMLCFDVPVDKEAEKLADELGVKVFKADIIYHLFDAFTAYNAQMLEAKRADLAPKAVWPCRLKIIACFAKRDPIIVGCDIIEGSLRVGTPLCVVRTDATTKKKEIIGLGKITSLEINHKVKDVIKKSEAGGGVAVKIEHASYESAKQYGRHFDENDELISLISRTSIDTLKDLFRAEVPKEDWVLIKNLKTKLDIV
ncbi:BZ3500_MvSof-1268-A1-R1_Chr7-2g09505 [Microbotryum saponariae]|uniref:Eukaryotic translation initiation factor 5B n=1 Tax=Microbotryum saponariae TaxID=289078 RepID=A0A2X0NBL0_9BASI|nr:BZ3501_MvSof-1269-A2-R1_Chr7-1g09205 [Microbotryum saponariae]SDA02586.1 BZ3500_MvSof-1268-A1-R1_Chr7-2g09505 [Microbotryum saponariae]